MNDLGSSIKKIYNIALFRVMINRFITNFLNLVIYCLIGLAVLKILGLADSFFKNIPLFVSCITVFLVLLIYLSFRHKPNKKQVLASVDHHFHTKGALSILVDSQIDLEKNVFLTLLNKSEHIKPLDLFKKFKVHFNRWNLIGATLCLNLVLFIAIPSDADIRATIKTNIQVTETNSNTINQAKTTEEILEILDNDNPTDQTQKPETTKTEEQKPKEDEVIETNTILQAKPNQKNASEKTESEPNENINPNEKESANASSGAGSDEVKETKTTTIEKMNTENGQKIDINIDLTVAHGGQGENAPTETDLPVNMRTQKMDFDLKSYQSNDEWRKLKPKYKRLIELYFDRGTSK